MKFGRNTGTGMGEFYVNYFAQHWNAAKCITVSFRTDICYIDILLSLSTLTENQRGWLKRENYWYWGNFHVVTLNQCLLTSVSSFSFVVATGLEEQGDEIILLSKLIQDYFWVQVNFIISTILAYIFTISTVNLLN